MTDDQPWTIGRLLTWTCDYFRDHGSDSPRLEAEILLAEARGCQRIELYTAYDEVPNHETRIAYRELVRRRVEGTPVAYLVGHREFYSLEFRVTPDVLIPRPETELLVVALLDLAKEHHSDDQPIAICDVGTGSGVLAVCAAKHLPNSQITAVDSSTAALEVACKNAEQHQVAARIQFIESDLLASVSNDSTFDFIISNPPYISTAELINLPAEVRDFEPHQALHGGDQGTEIIERMLPQAVMHLRPNGRLLIEISPMITEQVQQLVESTHGLSFELTTRDLAGHDRIIQAVKNE